MPVRPVPVLTVLAVLTLVATACGSSGGSKSGGSSSTSASSSTSTTTTGATATAWQDVTATWKALAPAPFATGRQQVADSLAALRRGQDTSEVGQVTVARVGTGEPLVVTLAETGVADPAVVRVVTEITLEPGEPGWVVSAARQRSDCLRATAPDATSCA